MELVYTPRNQKNKIMKLLITLSIVLMTKAVFAQHKRSMIANVGDPTQTKERAQVE